MRRYRFLVLLVCIGSLTLAQAQKKGRELRGAQQGSQEQNKATARRVFEEIFNQGRFGEVNKLYARDCKVSFGGRSQSLSEGEKEARGWRSAAPDLAMTINQISANGDVVTINWTANGTHTRRGNGLKPTGKHVTVSGRTEFRFANGKIVEANTSEYRPELYRQLGISKTGAAMIDTTEKLWASLKQMFPDPLYASLQ